MKKNELALICETHGSPIGGLCSDPACMEPPFIFCIKCVVDNDLCIRRKNHKLIAIKEFMDTFFAHKSVSDFKDFLQLYRETNKIDFNQTRRSIKNYLEIENNLFENLTSILQDKLNFLFEKERGKISQAEKAGISDFLSEKEIISNVQNEFENYFMEGEDVKPLKFEEYCIQLLKAFKEGKVTMKEMFTEISNYLNNFKFLLNKCNEDRVFKALDKIAYYVYFSSRPINVFKTEMENKSRIMSRSLMEELNFYFKNKEKDIQISRLMSKDSFTFPKSPEKRLSITSKGSSREMFFAKGYKKENYSSSSGMKKVAKVSAEKSVYRKYSSLTLSKQNILPSYMKQTFSKNIINDDEVVVIDKFNIIICSSGKNLYFYDFINSLLLYTITLPEGHEFYQKKYVVNNLADCVYVLTSNKSLYEISIGEYVPTINSGTNNTGFSPIEKEFKFGSELTENALAFDVIVEEEPLFGMKTLTPTKIVYLSSFSQLSIWSLVGEEIKFISSINNESNSDSNSNSKACPLKMEYFEANFTNNTDNNLLTSESSMKKYLINMIGGGITVYEVNVGFSSYYKIPSTYSTNQCNAFYLENLTSTNEAYLYSAWQNGSIFIHSIRSRILIKEVKHFNLQSIPLLSLCFINEKYLLVGGNKIMFLVNHANQKSSTFKWKHEIDGKLLGIKIWMNKQKEENLITFTDKGEISLWSNKKIK